MEVVLLLTVLDWIVYSLQVWWYSREGSVTHLRTISQIRRARYHNYISQTAQCHACGELDERGTHLTVASLIRALGTERPGCDLEVAIVAEIRTLVPIRPRLTLVLKAYETPGFIDERVDGAAGGPSLSGGTQGAGGIDILTLTSQAVDT